MNLPDEQSRYSRQMRLPAIGNQGQERLAQSRVLLVGMGALGACSAELLARAGIGHLRLVDRDIVELSNLQRQLLYSEDDARQGLPKAICAGQRLAQINSQISLEPIVADVTFQNIEQLVDQIDLIVDGTDNFETRFLINDISVARGIPWIYGGCLACDGQTMNILPGDTACLSCLMPDGPPTSGELPTCDTAGVLGAAVTLVASLQVVEAIKFLSGNATAMSRELRAVSLWDNRMRSLIIERRARPVLESGQHHEKCDVCTTCVTRQFPWLNGQLGSESTILCGRNAVQISPDRNQIVDFEMLSGKLTGLGEIQQTPYFLRVRSGTLEMTLFPDGRAIVSGTDQIAIAKSLFARLVGH
ncbi:MAG TPA: ThiF family adenylyltransferase [Pirellulaceae bacterium]|nr:ThiF family adenylyltransferase [Pirellulaceae bacterium]